MSKLEADLLFQIKACGLRYPLSEYRFHPTRRWRFDFAYPELMLAIEVEGGAWNGRHTRGAGFIADLEKYDAAMRLGWNVYRCGADLIKTGQAVQTIQILIDLCSDKQELKKDRA